MTEHEAASWYVGRADGRAHAVARRILGEAPLALAAREAVARGLAKGDAWSKFYYVEGFMTGAAQEEPTTPEEMEKDDDE